MYYTTVSAELFNPTNITYIQAEVQRALGGRVYPSTQVVLNVLDNVARNYRPHTGDIMSRYIVRASSSQCTMNQQINHKTISIIVNAIRDEQEQQQINASLSVWPRDDLRFHGPIKMKRNDHIKGVFMMNY